VPLAWLPDMLCCRGISAFPNRIADRLAFALQADIFVLLWVLFGVGLVSRSRRHVRSSQPTHRG
jgi:hypothetical protein